MMFSLRGASRMAIHSQALSFSVLSNASKERGSGSLTGVELDLEAIGNLACKRCLSH